MKKKTSIKNIATYIHQIYSNGLLKLKNMDWFIVCDFIYMYFCVWILFGTYYRDSMYDMLKQKNICGHKLLEKIWPKQIYELLNGLKWAIFS